MSRNIEPDLGGQGQKPEGGEKLQSLEITAEFLAQIITSESFLLRLGEAYKVTSSLGESGFAIGFHLDTGEIAPGRVIDTKKKKTSKSSFSMPPYFERMSLHGLLSKGVVPLIALHTHPGEICSPSLGDLHCLLRDRTELPSKRRGERISLYPIMIIAVPFLEEGREMVQLILFQETPGTSRRSNELAETDEGEITSEVKRRAEMLYDIIRNELGHGDFLRRTDIKTMQRVLSRLPGMNIAWISCVRSRTDPEDRFVPLQSKEEITELLKDFAFQPKKTS